MGKTEEAGEIDKGEEREQERETELANTGT